MFERHRYPRVIILQAVYFKLRFTLSYRDVEELMSVRGIKVDHSTIQRWVFKFSKEVEKKVLSHLLDKNLKVQLFFNSKRPMT